MCVKDVYEMKLATLKAIIIIDVILKTNILLALQQLKIMMHA